MHRTRIKICGICRAADASVAVAEGADAIGMVFHSASHRSVSIDEARLIAHAAGPFVSIVGLFVDASVEEVLNIARLIPFSMIQLHGNESPELAAKLSPLRIIKAIRPNESDFAQWKSAKIPNLEGLLLESPGATTGGSGISNDWDAVEKLQNSGVFQGGPRVILAGGLTPKNIGQIVRRFQPYAVDVSSGVETGRREKSPERIAEFIRAVHKADHDIAHAKKHS